MAPEQTELERLARLEEKMDTQETAQEGISHFLFGNSQPGYVKTMDDRLKRIEYIGIGILVTVVARSGGDIFGTLAKWIGK